MKFKIWKWLFEFRIKRIPDEQKIDWLCKYLFEYADKTQDLVVSTKEFKQINLCSFRNKELDISVGTKRKTIKIKGGYKS